MATLTLNRRIRTWAEDHAGDPVAVFVAPDVTDWEEFARAAVSLASDAPTLIWPADLILDGARYGDIQIPSSHVFAATTAALPWIRAAAQSDCERLLPRLLGLNPQLCRHAVRLDVSPRATSVWHAFRPLARYRAMA